MNRENLQILYNMLTEGLQRCIRIKNDLQSLKVKFWLIKMNYPAASYGVSKASIRNRPFVAS